MEPADPPAIPDVLADYEHVVEVGVGNRPDVARELARRGVTVLATDVVERTVPAGVTFTIDDVTTPVTAVYEDADAIYALRLPPELQRHVWRVARGVESDLLFTTLGGDPALVPAEPRTVAEGTLFVATHN